LCATGVLPRMIHIQMNQKKETEISLSKQNVRAVWYLVGRERHKQVDAELGGSASCFDGFEEIMESYLLRARCDAHARDPDAPSHLTLDTVVCLGLHVEEEANQYVSVLSTPSLLLNPVRALQHGMVHELYGDATHKISHHLINLSQMSVNDVSGRSHLWGLMRISKSLSPSRIWLPFHHQNSSSNWILSKVSPQPRSSE
jgi:hypothetical protein